MVDLIRWLIEMEFMAGRLYADSASFFRRNEQLSRFLHGLSQDEVWHYDIMNRVDDILRQDSHRFRSAVTLDSASRLRLEEPLLKYRERLTAGNLTPEEMFDYIVSIEFSEFNYFFLYIIETLKESDPEFQHIAAKIESHKKSIERFVARLPDSRRYLERIRGISSVWQERILLVDDEPAIVKLLSAVFEMRFCVEVAFNGAEALDKISGSFFDVIVSDVDMPVMSGIEFFSQAKSKDPTIGERFLFFSGDISPEKTRFFEEHHVAFLAKPSTLEEIESSVSRIVKEAPSSQEH
ncbi:MAG: response regulator [Desulfomonilia bacterium]